MSEKQEVMEEAIKDDGIFDGVVVNILPFGVVVELEDKRTGLVHISQLSDEYVKDVNDIVTKGDTVTVKILSIDEKDNKIAFTMKESIIDPTSVVKRHRPKQTVANFEEKFKEWQKTSNEIHASINRRNKRR